MTQKEARVVVLADIANHYNSTNRSAIDSLCMYNGPDGNKCAAARWMNNPELAVEKRGIFRQLHLLNEIGLIAGAAFMVNIQKLHDNSLNWDEKGLSEHGKIIVSKIERIFILK